MINNLQEDYCSFEVSKLLKERGFDIETMYHYAESTNPELGVGEMFEVSKTYWPNVKKSWFAPTHALAVKWVRENFGIWIHSMQVFKEFYGYIQTDWNYKTKEQASNTLKFMEKRFNLPEEAVEAALLCTLQNLIQ